MSSKDLPSLASFPLKTCNVCLPLAFVYVLPLQSGPDGFSPENSFLKLKKILNPCFSRELIFHGPTLLLPNESSLTVPWPHDNQAPVKSALMDPNSAGKTHRPLAGQVGAWARRCPGHSGAAAAAD